MKKVLGWTLIILFSPIILSIVGYFDPTSTPLFGAIAGFLFDLLIVFMILILKLIAWCFDLNK